METRASLAERVLISIYGRIPTADAHILEGLAVKYINTGLAMAAESMYKGSLKVDSMQYLGDAFTATFSDTVKADSTGAQYAELPEMPFSIGRSEGILPQMAHIGWLCPRE